MTPLTRTLLAHTSLFAIFALTSHAASAATGPAFAENDARRDFSHAQIVSDNELAALRGGFSVGSMNVAFTYQLASSINGQIQPTLTFSSQQIDQALANAKNAGHATIPAVNVPAVTAGTGTPSTQVSAPTITTQNTAPANTSVNLVPLIPISSTSTAKISAPIVSVSAPVTSSVQTAVASTQTAIQAVMPTTTTIVLNNLNNSTVDVQSTLNMTVSNVAALQQSVQHAVSGAAGVSAATAHQAAVSNVGAFIH